MLKGLLCHSKVSPETKAQVFEKLTDEGLLHPGLTSENVEVTDLVQKGTNGTSVEFSTERKFY